MTTEVTTSNDQNILDTLLVIIKRKQDHWKEGKAIRKLEAIYQSELKSIQDKMHRTKDWTITLIESMDDDHLLNTIKLFLRQNRWEFSSVPKRYLDEAKKRKGLLEQLLEYEPVIEMEDEEDDNDWRF